VVLKKSTRKGWGTKKKVNPTADGEKDSSIGESVQEPTCGRKRMGKEKLGKKVE